MAINGKGKPGSAHPILRSTADFARYVGLARTTVSRVLNGQPGLKRKTIDRVHRALAETGFTPNAHALHLKGKRTAMIGLCLGGAVTPAAVRQLAALQHLLRARGYAALIDFAAPGASRDTIRQFLSLRVEAVVLAGHFSPGELEARLGELTRQGTPHLLLDGPGGKLTPAIAPDHAAGMAALTTHLHALGHRTFALIGFPPATGRHDHLGGIIAALRAHHLDPAAALRRVGEDHPQSDRDDFAHGQTHGALLAAMPDRPTALLAASDTMAAGVLHALHAAGLKVPRDVSLTGIGDLEASRLTTPPLTTLDPDIPATSTAAAEIILAQLAHPEKTTTATHWIQPRLIARASTGPAKK